MNRPFFNLTRSRLIRYAHDQVKAWAGRQLKTTFREPCTAFGVIDRHGQLVGAVIFNDYEACNVEMTMIWPRGFGYKDACREAFSYAFNDLGVRRISLTVPERRVADIRYAERWGWKIEGRKWRYYPDDNAIIMGMLREHCRFLRD